MSGRITRKVLNLHGSKAITLPPDWPCGDRVHLLVDRYLLVVPEKDGHKVETAMEQAILGLLSNASTGV